ncbi:retrotransposon protein [Panicum miliaceum]|uniref:Retrotransposon protein n=1 Tax=Panicum miliaceum TaxID=4540 RepID=A0A3L6TGV2_PANMI|nr:retrotransposon protein [Panicum miliaceum]
MEIDVESGEREQQEEDEEEDTIPRTEDGGVDFMRDFHNCKQGNKEPLQGYRQRIIKMRAKAPNMADLSILEATINGRWIGPCQDYLDRCKPHTVGELFGVMRSTASPIEDEGEE